MSVRVVARIRPLLKSEIERDTIVEAAPPRPGDDRTIVKIPNPKNEKESFSFQFNSVYDRETTQQQLFDGEIAPTVKHLFNGFDVTIFAYGVTGTGKTHTMRGGKSLAERGVIPRLLSSIYRRGRKIEKDTDGETKVEVTMTYYEIYNDKVYDLFEAPEKRTLAGLPIRDNNGKTVVAGLTERPCTTLKDFEVLYDQANVNRSTSATKLNAHSSRSHAILCVKVAQITDTQIITSTASAIDLAGSEDNRRTDNGKERLVESSAINKSLFVLAQCVEAISKNHSRIPYRESKMTRILSLGQNNGLTIMILNLAPVKSYHLDTLSSLNFANRTKKIEVREIENEPISRGPTKQAVALTGSAIQRQPLRPVPSAANVGLKSITATKPTKTFSVYSERSNSPRMGSVFREGALKRGSDAALQSSRPAKTIRTSNVQTSMKLKEPGLSRANIEELVNRMVDEKLASRALNDAEKSATPALSEEVQRRLAALEERVEKKEDSRAEGLQYLLMAKQHQVRGEDGSALKMYQLALPYFPDNEKLGQKMLALQEKLRTRHDVPLVAAASASRPLPLSHSAVTEESYDDDDYVDAGYHDDDGDDSFHYKPRPKKVPKTKFRIFQDGNGGAEPTGELSPRSAQLLRVINTRDLSQIRALKGVGAKRAEAIVSALCSMDGSDDGALVTDLEQLGGMKGIGAKAVENMRFGIFV